MANIQCPECGKAVAENARVCPHCGYDPSLERSREAKKKSYWAAAIICGVMLIVGGVAIFIAISGFHPS